MSTADQVTFHFSIPSFLGAGRRLVLYSLLGCATTLPGMAQDSSHPLPGAATFKTRCAMCHGDDATGNTKLGQALKAPNLHSKEVQALSDDELTTVVTKGKNSMPAFGEQLTAAEIGQVIKYLRTLKQ
jgi:cytochrome c6